jgi:hypothetical protein
MSFKTLVDHIMGCAKDTLIRAMTLWCARTGRTKKFLPGKNVHPWPTYRDHDHHHPRVPRLMYTNCLMDPGARNPTSC